MPVLLQQTDWPRVEQCCAQVASAWAQQNDTAGVLSLRTTLAAELRGIGWLVRENTVRPAFYHGREVSTYTCPLLLEESGVVLPVPSLPETELARQRLRNLCATLNLRAAFYVACDGSVLSEINDT